MINLNQSPRPLDLTIFWIFYAIWMLIWLSVLTLIPGVILPLRIVAAVLLLLSIRFVLIGGTDRIDPDARQLIQTRGWIFAPTTTVIPLDRATAIGVAEIITYTNHHTSIESHTLISYAITAIGPDQRQVLKSEFQDENAQALGQYIATALGLPFLARIDPPPREPVTTPPLAIRLGGLLACAFAAALIAAAALQNHQVWIPTASGPSSATAPDAGPASLSFSIIATVALAFFTIGLAQILFARRRTLTTTQRSRRALALVATWTALGWLLLAHHLLATDGALSFGALDLAGFHLGVTAVLAACWYRWWRVRAPQTTPPSDGFGANAYKK